MLKFDIEYPPVPPLKKPLGAAAGKSRAKLFGILTEISTKLEELNESDLQFVIRNIKQTFNPGFHSDPNSSYEACLKNDKND